MSEQIVPMGVQWANRCMETHVKSEQIDKLFNKKGCHLLANGYILISNSKTGIAAVLPQTLPLVETLTLMEKYALHCESQ